MRMWQAVCDYLWFVFILKGNEFHPSLELNMRKSREPKSWNKECERVTKDRERAHRLDQHYTKTKLFCRRYYK